MSSWSDWKCGALSDDEYAFASAWEYAGDGFIDDYNPCEGCEYYNPDEQCDGCDIDD